VRSGSPERPHFGTDPRSLVGGYSNTSTTITAEQPPPSHARSSFSRGLTESATNMGSTSSSVRLRPFSPPEPTISTSTEAQGVLMRPWTSNGLQHAQQALHAAMNAAESANRLAARSPSPLRQQASVDLANASNSKSQSASSSLDAHLPAFMATDEVNWSKCLEGHHEDDEFERGKSLRNNGQGTFRFRTTEDKDALPTLQPVSDSAQSLCTERRRAPRLITSNHRVAQPIVRPQSSAGDFRPVRGVGGSFGAPPLVGRFGTSAGYRKHVMDDYNRKVRTL
jgi:hypothetical protein